MSDSFPASGQGGGHDGEPPPARPPNLNLPPGIKIQRGTTNDDKPAAPASLSKLPPGISVQSKSSSGGETKKLSLPPGISVQSSASLSISENKSCSSSMNLPPGISVSNGSAKTASPSPKLPSGVSVVTSSGGGSVGSSSNPLERLNQLSGISMGSSSSSGGGGAATTTSRSFPAGLQISSKPVPGADNSSAQATKPSLEPSRQGSDDTTPGSKQSEGETPKTYRPLVKHFDPNDENVGFDLAKVKMERSSSPTGSRRQLLLAQASGAKTSGSDGGDGSRNENSESSMPLPPSSFQSRRQNQTSEQQRTNTTTNPAASEKSGDKSESSESGVVAGSTTNDESTKSNDGENETGSVATRGPADDNVGSEAKGQSQSADSGKVTAALEFEEEAECFDLSDDCDEDGVPTGRSKNADQEMEVKEEEEDYDDGSQDDGMLTDEDSFKKPNGGLINSSPGKRFMEERNSFSSAEDGGGTGKDRTGDGTASDYGSESSGFKAGGSMDSSLATNRQYYEQQLNYYQNNPMTGRDTICVFCLTRCSSKDRRPQLLACLHSACFECFNNEVEKISAQNKGGSKVVDVDDETGGVDPLVSEVVVPCPLCRVTTSKDDLVDNHFLQYENDDNDENDVATHLCQSCDDQSIATSYCEDCEEYLCDDCVRAHRRVKMTKDHKITSVASSSKPSTKRATSELKDMTCQLHPGEKLNFYCEVCEKLTCRQCQMLPKCGNHSFKTIEEIVPEMTNSVQHNVADIKLKKNSLEENKAMLGTKLSEVSIKEKAILKQLVDVKNYLVTKIEARFNELNAEVSKAVRGKKKAIQGRKDMLHKHYLQTDYALAFADFTLASGDNHALVMSKKLIDRQFRRLKKLDPSTGLSDNSREMKIDLYFQHYSGQQLHSSMESVLKQLMDDVKVLDAPPPPPVAPKPAPPPPALSASPMASPPPVTPASSAGVSSRGSVSGGGMLPHLLTSPITAAALRGRGSSPSGGPSSGMVSRGGGMSPAKRGTATMTLPRPPALTAKPGVTRGGIMPSRGVARGGMMPSRGVVRPGMGVSRGGGIMSPSKIMAARGRASAVLQRTMGARGAAPMRGGVSPVRGGVPSRGGVPAMARGGMRPGAPSMVRGRGGAVPGGQPVRPRPQTSPQGGAPLQRPSPVATPHLPPGMSVTRTKPGSGGAQPPVSSTSASAPPRPAAPQPQRPATSTVPAPQQWGNSPYSHAAYGSHQQGGGSQQLQQNMQMHQQQQRAAAAAAMHQQRPPAMTQPRPPQYHQQQQQYQQAQQQHYANMSNVGGRQLNPQQQQLHHQQMWRQQQQIQYQQAMRQQQQQQQAQQQSQGPSWHTPVGGYGANGATPAASSSSGAAAADNSFKIRLPPMGGGGGGAQNGNNSAAGHLNSSGGSVTQQSSSGEALPPTTTKGPSPSKAAADSRIPSLDDDIQSLMDAIGDDEDGVGISPEGWFNTGKTKDLPDDDPLKIDTDSAATTSKAATSKPLWSPGKEADKKDDSSLSTPEKPPEASEIPKSGARKGPATGTVKINLTKSSGSDSLVSVNLGSMLDQADSIKLELGTIADQSENKGKGRPPGKSKPGPKSKGNKGKMKIEPKTEPASPPPPAAPGTPEMEGKEDGEEEGSEEWCAVCHDGGDMLYCCDRCPKIYHLSCYIPPLTEEPPDDWVCLMCATPEEVASYPNKRGKKGHGKLGERDWAICRRIMFEMYNIYPESVTFKDASDLNFPEYRAVIKEPIALNEINERLDKEHEDQYESIELFLRDVRKMFWNCRKFHEKGTTWYDHAGNLEEVLDKTLLVWLPEFAYDTYDPKAPVLPIKRKYFKEVDDGDIGPSSPKKSKKEKKSKKKKKKKSKRKEEDYEDDEELDGDSQDSQLDEEEMSEGEKLDELDELEEILKRKKKKRKSDE